MELGSLVCFDDLHFLSNRLPDGSLCTLFTEPGALERGHWIYESPFSSDLRAALLGGAGAAGVAVRDGGCYGHVDGPRFNTRAEIRGLAAAGVTAVSQTAGPETVLCGEAELPYALLGFLTDYANGVKDVATPVETLVEMMAASGEAFAAVLRAALPLIDAPAPPGHRLPLPGHRLISGGTRGRSSRPGLRGAGRRRGRPACGCGRCAGVTPSQRWVARTLSASSSSVDGTGIAALVLLLLVAEEDRREGALALVGVGADEAQPLVAAAQRAGDPQRVGAGQAVAADALERHPRTHPLAGTHARRQRDVADERLVGAAVDLQQHADAGHRRRLAGEGVDRGQRAAEVVGRRRRARRW